MPVEHGLVESFSPESGSPPMRQASSVLIASSLTHQDPFFSICIETVRRSKLNDSSPTEGKISTKSVLERFFPLPLRVVGRERSARSRSGVACPASCGQAVQLVEMAFRTFMLEALIAGNRAASTPARAATRIEKITLS